MKDFVNACEHVNPEFHQYWINRLEDPDIPSEITLHKHFGHSEDECQKGS